MARLFILLCSIVTLTVGVKADDWPSWRGPSGTGVTTDTGLPEQWSDANGVAWRTRLPGVGVSTPVVAGPHVYVSSQIGAGQRRAGMHPSLVQGAGERNLERAETRADSIRFALTALNWKDGREVWQHTLAAEGPLVPVHDKHNLATPSPVTDGRLVVAWYGTGQVVALDAASGALRWSKHLGAEYGPFQINWGHSSSPLLHGDLVILPCYHESGAYLLALDKATGEVRWKRDRPHGAHSYSTPVVVSHDGRAVLVFNSSVGVEGFDAVSGEPLWQVLEGNRFPIPMPVHHEGVVYLSRGYRSSPYLAIRLGGRGDVTNTHVVWRTPTGAPYVSSLVYYDGLLYMGSELGILTAIDPASGDMVWRERVGGVFTASPVAGDGKVYFASETGETVVLAAGRTPKVLARNRLDAHLVASPAIAHGRLFLRADGELIAVAGAR